MVNVVLVSGILVSIILASGILMSGILMSGILVRGILVSGILVNGILVSPSDSCCACNGFLGQYDHRQLRIHRLFIGMARPPCFV